MNHLDIPLQGETGKIEYKVDIPPKSESYMRTVVAFANAEGGQIIFIVEIAAGTQRPYFIKSRGTVDGVYVRVSGTTRKAALYQIQEMILHSGNRFYDQEKVYRELQDDEIAFLCDRIYAHALECCPDDKQRDHIKKIGKNQLISSRLIVEENGRCFATNGYQLLDGKLDDYPDAVIQCAVFKGTSRNIFITRKEFSGPIDEQVEAAYAFVLEHIDMGARFDGVVRQDIYELPIRSIREMITNAACHRSYLSPGKIQVALYDDRLEVTSPGILDYDLTIEKIKTGLSKIRNRGIAEAFLYMHMIEGWGSGIPDLFRDAQQYGLPEPVLSDLGSDFRVNLYRCPLHTDHNGIIPPALDSQQDTSLEMENGTKLVQNETNQIQNETIRTENETNWPQNETNQAENETNRTKNETNDIELTPKEKQLLEAIQLNPDITQKRLSERTGIALSTVKRILPELQKKGILERAGTNRSGRWIITGRKK